MLNFKIKILLIKLASSRQKLSEQGAVEKPTLNVDVFGKESFFFLILHQNFYFIRETYRDSISPVCC